MERCLAFHDPKLGGDIVPNEGHQASSKFKNEHANRLLWAFFRSKIAPFMLGRTPRFGNLYIYQVRASSEGNGLVTSVTLVNVSTDNESKTPYLLTLQDARIYLGLGKNSFNKYIRPQVNELRVGRRVMFRRIDLEAVAEDNLSPLQMS